MARPQTAPRVCGKVYVELNLDPALDRVLRCGRPFCTEHRTQLAWVRQSRRRIAAYAELVARLERAGDVGATQAGLL